MVSGCLIEQHWAIQYFVFHYLLLSQRRYVFISLKGNSFICVDPIQSSLLWNLPLLTILLTSIFLNFPSTLAYIPPFQTYLGLLHSMEKKLPFDYASLSSSPSLSFIAVLLESSLCLMCPLYHFLFIPWLLCIGRGHQWACNCQIHWPLFLSTWPQLLTLWPSWSKSNFPSPTPTLVFWWHSFLIPLPHWWILSLF